MRARMKRTCQVAAVLAATLALAGCGGGDAAVPADTGATPTPATDPNASTVADGGGAAGTTATDPATGQPITTDTTGSASTATVPDLSGGDVSISLSGAGKPHDSFLASRTFDEGGSDSATTPTDGVGSTTPTSGTTPAATDPTTTTADAPTYSGARIYVNGMTYSVNVGDAFPKKLPIFRLTSVDENTIEVQLVAGEFTSTGSDGTILDRGVMVTALNSSEEQSYKIKYLKPLVGDAAGL